MTWKKEMPCARRGHLLQFCSWSYLESVMLVVVIGVSISLKPRHSRSRVCLVLLLSRWTAHGRRRKVLRRHLGHLLLLRVHSAASSCSGTGHHLGNTKLLLHVSLLLSLLATTGLFLFAFRHLVNFLSGDHVSIIFVVSKLPLTSVPSSPSTR